MKRPFLMISTLLTLSNATEFSPHPYPTKEGVLLPDESFYPKQTRNLRTAKTNNKHGRKLTTGTFHNLVLLLKFSDHTSRSLPPRAHYDLLYNSPSTSVQIVPTGSVKTYFHTASYGALNIQTTVLGWITLSKSESYYANGDYGFVKLQEAIIEALQWVEEQGYNFAEFDANDDGIVDGFGLLLSGYGAEFAGADCHGADPTNRIWSHKGGVDYVSSTGVKVERYYVSSGLRNKCASDIARMGVIVHEIGHYLGLPDLYDGTWEGSGIGALDVMSQSWGWDGTGVYPPLLSAWSKSTVGWVTPTTIQEDGMYTLEKSSTSDQVYKITSGFPQGEYLLLENRQPKGDYDALIPHGGIAIWHIDENASQNTRGFPGQTLWPENGKHYRVALLAADGNYDLEKGVNQGDGHDLWHASSDFKELNVGTGETYPNTDSYRGGVIKKTGIRIYDFSSSKDVMSFKVSGIQARMPTKAPSKPPSAAPSHQPVTEAPTIHPTVQPTKYPSVQPTKYPSVQPTKYPSVQPTKYPTVQPSKSPATRLTDPPSRSPSRTSLTTTKAPAEHPSTQAPITSKRTEAPTTKPTPSPSSSPTQSPTTQEERCDNRCFEPVPTSECPLNKMKIDCQFSTMGGLCYSENNECGTNPNLANCNGFSVYRRVRCKEGIEVTWSRPPSKHPTTMTPSESPAKQLSITQDNCKYYPAIPLDRDNKCISDCHLPKPTYMENNPKYEFDTLELCCEAHYQGKKRCRSAPLNIKSEWRPPEEQELVSTTGLASIGGQVWNDVNGDQWRDTTDEGLEGAIVDLYECDYNTWVKSTRTASSGLYFLSRLPPGKYSLKITAPSGYHFVFDPIFWKDEDRDPQKATTPCFDLRPDVSNAHFDVGLVPDLVAPTATELVSPIDGWDVNANDVASDAVSAAHSKSSRGSSLKRPAVSKTRPVVREKVQVAPNNEEPLSTIEHTKSGSSNKGLHSKSFTDGNTEKPVRHVVTLQATESITISQHEETVGQTQDLKVSKYDDILLKFDIALLKYTKPSSATLRLYSLSSSPTGGSIHKATHLWNSDVAWEDAPEAGEVLYEIGKIHPNEWVEIDVTEAIITNQDLVSLRIGMSSSNSDWSARYSNNVQLRIFF